MIVNENHLQRALFTTKLGIVRIMCQQPYQILRFSLHIHQENKSRHTLYRSNIHIINYFVILDYIIATATIIY